MSKQQITLSLMMLILEIVLETIVILMKRMKKQLAIKLHVIVVTILAMEIRHYNSHSNDTSLVTVTNFKSQNSQL